MKRIIAVLIAMLLLVIAVSVAYAGHTAGQLESAGWTCENLPPRNWVHCFPPSISFPDDLIAGRPKTVQVKVFDVDGLTYFGTELLIRADLYHGQSCPQDNLETYENLSGEGLPYFACHHLDTSAHE